MCFPIGVRFDPTDEELISEYLLKKVKGKPLPFEVAFECDVYNKNEEPWKKVFEANVTKTKEDTCYIFTKLKTKTEKAKRFERNTGKFATWKEQLEVKILNEKGKIIGSKRSFAYKKKQKKKKKKGSGESSIPEDKKERWIMYEYRLDGEYADLGKEVENYVLCKVTNKPPKGAKKNSKRQQSTSESYDNSAVPNHVFNELISTPNEQLNNNNIPEFYDVLAVPNHECNELISTPNTQLNNSSIPEFYDVPAIPNHECNELISTPNTQLNNSSIPNFGPSSSSSSSSQLNYLLFEADAGYINNMILLDREINQRHLPQPNPVSYCTL